ncbi:MAG: hypothetical protein OCD76_12515 [Reichenbachiella sp.]
MSKESSDTLYQLIKSLKKSEKRYFNLSVGSSENAKFLRLFQVIDSQKQFNDKEILIKAPEIKPSQLSNLKAHLYTRILDSLRDYNSSTLPNIKIRDMVDHAEILFNKSLYAQCAEIIKKAKKFTVKSDNLEMQLEILKWEKQMLARTTAKDNLEKTIALIKETQEVTARINNINSFSNLQHQLQAMYKKIGFIRNAIDYKKINELFFSSLPAYDESQLSVSEKLGLYNLYIGYYFFIQDFEEGNKKANQLVELFKGQKTLIQSRLETYINGINYQLIAQNKLMLDKDFQSNLRELRSLNNLPSAYLNENIRLKLLKYTFVHEFNRLFMMGDFQRGVGLIKRIKIGLDQFTLQLDPHSRMIMYYKTACLYFGYGDFKTTIKYLNNIFNQAEGDLREDIHGFARMLNLICHYELGNMELIGYYVRSTYRFLLKKEDLHQFQKYILNFLVRLKANITEKELKQRFDTLRKNLIPLSQDPFEKRAFIYFDIISWLESKIEDRKVQDIIQEKALKRINKVSGND